jgi:hypothetical protein
MKNTTKPICIRLETSWIKYLKQKARELAYKNDGDMNFHDLIRLSLKTMYEDIDNEQPK